MWSWKLLALCRINNRAGQNIVQDTFALVSLIFLFSHFHQTCLKQRCSSTISTTSSLKQHIIFTKQLKGTCRMQRFALEMLQTTFFLSKFGSPRKFLINSNYQLITRGKVSADVILVLPVQHSNSQPHHTYREKSSFIVHIV